jgi:nucleoid-associated protein YgaU
MTDKKLFRYTVYTLVATLLVPVLIILFADGGRTQVAVKLQAFALYRDPQALTGDLTINEGEPIIDSSVLDSKALTSDPSKAQNTVQNAQSTEQQAAASTQQGQAPSSITPAPTKSEPSQQSAKQATTYTVKDGDTYGCIAEKYYGSYDQWSRIYAANAGYAGYEEYGLAVGAKLQLPALVNVVSRR